MLSLCPPSILNHKIHSRPCAQQNRAVKGSWTCFQFWPPGGGRGVTLGLETVLLDCSSGFDCPNSWRLPLLHLSAVNRPPARTLSAWWIYGHAECPHPANYWDLKGLDLPHAPQRHQTSLLWPMPLIYTLSHALTHVSRSWGAQLMEALLPGRRLTELSTRKHE